MQKIKITTNGIALGKTIDITQKGNKAATTRIKKARNAWNILRKRLLNKANLKTRIKTLLWNALIRSTLAYALQTQELSEKDKKRTDSFTFSCMRHLKNQHWIHESQRPNRLDTYTALKQPTTILWIHKQRVNHMLQQTRNIWSIHNKQQQYVQGTIKLWQQAWEKQKEQLEYTKTRIAQSTSTRDRAIHIDNFFKKYHA